MNPFETIRLKKPKSSVFDLSHEHKLTCNMADLIPVYCQEVIPGDKFRVNTEMLLRMQPLLAPIMHRVNVYMHHFFVPNRIIWDDWESFITGGKTGNEMPNHPKFTGTDTDFNAQFYINSLGDYLGIPCVNYSNESGENFPSVSQLPFRAYQKIYDNYYKDPTLNADIGLTVTNSLDLAISGPAAAQLCLLRKRCWEKDYFTSCLPNAQRGNAVTLPLLGDAEVSGLPTFQKGGVDFNGTLQTNADGHLSSTPLIPESNLINISDGLTADLSTATSTTISDLRRAFSLQRWMEKMSRGGYRYVEQMLHMFGVKSSDARLQRAEYLGGGKLPIQISEVLQTSQSDDTAQGNMSGHGISAGTPSGFSRFFEEHGFVISILSVMPRTAYSQGLPRIFSKFDKFDYFWPDFAHIGEQPVFNRELYLNGIDTGSPEGTFGYQPRYSEYRYNYDRISGEFRTSLNFWHMGRLFTGLPALNNGFVEADPTTRIYPVEDAKYKKLIVQLYFSIQAIRRIPKFGDPI